MAHRQWSYISPIPTRFSSKKHQLFFTRQGCWVNDPISASHHLTESYPTLTRGLGMTPTNFKKIQVNNIPVTISPVTLKLPLCRSTSPCSFPRQWKAHPLAVAQNPKPGRMARASSTPHNDWEAFVRAPEGYIIKCVLWVLGRQVGIKAEIWYQM